jgi:UDP-glucose 4-epimerase
MRVLVTGSSGHLGQALMQGLGSEGMDVVGLDRRTSPYTDVVGSIGDRSVLRQCLEDVDAVIHAATLHKPHLAMYDPGDFIETNVLGTFNLLRASTDAGVSTFVLTSTTSAFGRALTPPTGAPAVWVTEGLPPVPRNIYGVTKVAAEDLCELFHRNDALACVVLRTSRFFPEADADPETSGFDHLNLKVNELLHRRVDLHDVVSAHRAALERARVVGFGRYIVSATTPFTTDQLVELRSAAPRVVERLFPEYAGLYVERGWTMSPEIDRVYVNAKARDELGWRPLYDFRHALECLSDGRDPRSPLALAVGSRGYH